MDVSEGDVKILPGGSSESHKLLVKSDGTWVEVRNPKGPCVLPLCPIDGHKLNVKNLRAMAMARDPKIVGLIDILMCGKWNSKLQIDAQKVSDRQSRHFSEEEVHMLVKADIITPVKGCSINYALENFKVPKKSGEDSRLISDCRDVNSQVTEYDELKMEMPKLHQVMYWGARYAVIWSVDANSYFFQFELKGQARSLFPLRISKDIREVAYLLNRLPMGFKLAPILAQRTSNIIVNSAYDIMRTEGLKGEIAAWVDNFLVFATSETDATRIMEILSRCLDHVDIKCKDIDKSHEMVGLVKANDGLVLQEAFRVSTNEHIEGALQAEKISVKEAQRLAGKLMWANFSVIRVPLACRPATLSLLRQLAKNSEPLQVSSELREELVLWKEGLNTTYHNPSEGGSTAVETWTDATPWNLAVVIGRKVFMAQVPFCMDIALMEAVAAGWGLLLTNRNTNLHLDNQVVAFALGKGHCSVESINRIINNIFKGNAQVKGRITWVPSEDQVADDATRHRLINLTEKVNKSLQSREKWITIKSFFIYNPNDY